MERLTKWLDDKKAICIKVCEKKCVDGNDWCPKCKPLTDVFVKLADYEDKQEQGVLISLPCKVGDEFWVIAYSNPKITHVRCTGYCVQEDARNGRKEAFLWLDSMENDRDYWKLSFDDFKKQCYLTRSEAEEALAKMGGE